MPTQRLINAYVLCGGQSRRMGQDKANLTHRGSSYVDHIAQTLAPLFNAVYAVGKDSQQINTRLPIINDLDNDHHPLWGIASAMSHSQYSDVFIIPCDIIQIQEKAVRTLLNENRACYAISQTQEQPLLGLYPVDWFQHTVKHAEQNKSVYKWSTKAARIPIDASNLTNVNHPWEAP